MIYFMLVHIRLGIFREEKQFIVTHIISPISDRHFMLVGGEEGTVSWLPMPFVW